MANMSYCRFDNTCKDLADCVEALRGIAEDGDSVSQREWERAKSMKKWCEAYLEIWEDMEEYEIQPNVID